MIWMRSEPLHLSWSLHWEVEENSDWFSDVAVSSVYLLWGNQMLNVRLGGIWFKSADKIVVV